MSQTFHEAIAILCEALVPSLIGQLEGIEKWKIWVAGNF